MYTSRLYQFKYNLQWNIKSWRIHKMWLSKSKFLMSQKNIIDKNAEMKKQLAVKKQPKNWWFLNLPYLSEFFGQIRLFFEFSTVFFYENEGTLGSPIIFDL